MRKLVLSLTAILCMAFLASNAFAASLYKAGNISIGAGYNSMSLFNTSVSGVNVQGSYFLDDAAAITIQYESLSATGGGTLSVLDLEAAWHIGFSDKFGAYLAGGFGSGTQSGVATSISLTILEAGLELKATDNIILGVGYKMDMDKAGTSVNGVTANVNLVF